MARNLIPTMPIHPNGYDSHIANTEIREASDSSAYGERIAQCVSHHLGEFNGTPIDRNLSSRVKKVLDVISDDFSAKDLPGESGWFTTTVASEVPPTPVGGPLMFTSSGSTTLTLYQAYEEEEGTSPYVPNLQVSSDGTNWTTIEKDSPYTFSGSIYVSGNNPNRWSFYDSELDIYSTFCIDMHGDNVHISGSIMSLIDPTLQTTEIPCADCFNSLFTPQLNEDLGNLPEIDASELVLVTPSADNCYGSLFSSTNIVNPPLLPSTTLAPYCYAYMFESCYSLTSAPALPATTLAEGCYEGMFLGCFSITSAPVLPATTLAEECYTEMFWHCTSLISAPALPATTLAEGCYRRMFTECTSLTSAPVLPVTELKGNCYAYMFAGCTSLTSAPTLPATVLEFGCYNEMFSGCTSLTSAPTLPATVLESECYLWMFANCTSLTSAPTLPATVLETGCYKGMFVGCTSLTSAPALSATTLASDCYTEMFAGCTSLTSAPTLPATVLETGCYAWMFSGCTSLTSAPALPATTLAEECYTSMFRDCTSLNYIDCVATDISETDCILEWVKDVSASGNFYGKTAAGWSDGESGIPSGWTKHLS